MKKYTLLALILVSSLAYSATNILTDTQTNTIQVFTTNYWFANSLLNNPNILQYSKFTSDKGELIYSLVFTNDAQVKALIAQKAQLFDKQAIN